MARRKEYTLEEIHRQRQKLSKRIDKKEQEIRRKWRDLVAPPEVDDTFHLDKPSRSGLLALRRFHDGLQTPALVRLLVRTEKEEIMPRPHPHDIPKRNRI